MELSLGDIVIFEHIPQNNPTEVKARPGLIISSQSFNRDNLDVIMVTISTRIRRDKQTEFIIEENDDLFKKTGLRKTSAIRCGSILSFPKSKLRRRIGKLPNVYLEKVVDRIISFITYR